MSVKVTNSSSQQDCNRFQLGSLRQGRNYPTAVLGQQDIRSQQCNSHRIVSCSLTALTVKLGLIILVIASLIKVTIAYQERLEQHDEISSILSLESAKLYRLQHRFDRLFTIGGNLRLLDEQGHLIAPDRLRIIWR